MNNEYPPVAFYFKLSFSGLSGSVDSSFKEVSGITMEMGTEEITEGGNNTHKHRVPTTVKFSNLVLKRGLVPKNSQLVDWCINTLGAGLSVQLETKDITVSLLNPDAEPLNSWTFYNAWPVKWSAANLNSMSNEVLIETLEFVYSHFEEVIKDDDVLANLFEN